MNALKRFQLAVLIFGAAALVITAARNDGVPPLSVLILYGFFTLAFVLE